MHVLPGTHKGDPVWGTGNHYIWGKARSRNVVAPLVGARRIHRPWVVWELVKLLSELAFLLLWPNLHIPEEPVHHLLPVGDVLAWLGRPDVP